VAGCPIIKGKGAIRDSKAHNSIDVSIYKMSEEERHKLVRDFEYKGRRCVVIMVDRRNDIKNIPGVSKRLKNIFKPYCNGYVELKKSEVRNNYYNYSISSDEVTYHGDLNFGNKLNASNGKTYIGFDSAHVWNDKVPKSKTAKYVENTCKKIVEELERSFHSDIHKII